MKLMYRRFDVVAESALIGLEGKDGWAEAI